MTILARRLILCLAVLCWLTGVYSSRAQTGPSRVVQLTLHDTVQPISADYLCRGLKAAAERNAALVIVSLDTPGGLLTSTRDMVAAIEQSTVPVAVFVSPAGARAGSAGFFLLEAADIAAMAPSTNAGASHPIVPGRVLDPVLNQKIENDTAAFLRSFVSRRGRNVEAAEDAVRNSKSYSDGESLKLKLVDFIAVDRADLLKQLDGKTIRQFNGEVVVLHLAGASFENIDPTLRERLLTRLTNPDFAVVCLLCGILLVYAEFNIPGTIIPGALGALLILLALFGLNLLPVRHTAVALLCVGLALMLLELKVHSHGVLALTGIVTLVVGLATLVDAPVDALRVHAGTAVAVGVGFGSISMWLAWMALLARRNKVLLGPHAMVGNVAIARTPLSPNGQVEVRGEIWQAELAGGAFAAEGASLIVDAVSGLQLLVSVSPTPKR